MVIPLTSDLANSFSKIAGKVLYIGNFILWQIEIQTVLNKQISFHFKRGGHTPPPPLLDPPLNMSVHTKKSSWMLLLRFDMKKIRILPFFGPKWSKMIPMAILKLVICNVFYCNPTLTQMEASVIWGKKIVCSYQIAKNIYLVCKKIIGMICIS